MTAAKTISILGATGSVGASTRSVMAEQPGAYEVDTVSARDNVDELARLARDVRARHAVIANNDRYVDLKAGLAGTGTTVAAGPSALVEAATRPVDVVMAAIVGAAGLAPTYAALAAGRTVAIANKECLVAAGDVFMEAVRRFGGRLLPVDSEHNAVFQILQGHAIGEVARLVLTASGGPFRTSSAEEITAARPADAIAHPNWSMGAKISVDSATMMNKGLEVIEACHLFGVARDRVGVLIHPESIVHGLVEFTDGGHIAALSPPDMRVPVAYCLAWPERAPRGAIEPLDLVRLGRLTFEDVDVARYPAFATAMTALDAGGAATNILNAANEIAVEAFLAERIRFPEIAALVGETVEAAICEGIAAPATIDEAMDIDGRGRRLALERLDLRPAA